MNSKVSINLSGNEIGAERSARANSTAVTYLASPRYAPRLILDILQKIAMTALKDITTTKYLGVFVLLFAISIILEFIGEQLWVNYHISADFQEVVSGALGWIAIIGIFSLVFISPFRPRSKFSLRGDCKKRALVFGLCSFAAFGLCAAAVIAIASAI